MAARPPKQPRITAEQRAELLRVLGIGLELRSACSRAKVSVAAVQADAKLYAEMLEALRLGIAKLRERAVELTFSKETSAGSRAALLDRILNRRDDELARLEAALPQPEASPTTSRDDLMEQIAQLFERMLANDPLELLPRYIAVAFSTGRLSAEATAAGQQLVTVLGDHPPLLYSPAWWKEAQARGFNGLHHVSAPAKPAEPEPAVQGEVIPPVLDEAQPLPSNRAPAVRRRVPPAPPATMAAWYGPDWERDSPWAGR
jgi:hypothetical protein